MTKQAGLIEMIFAGQRTILSRSLLEWMDASPRFTTFVDTYRDKIRKKIRLASDPESRLDVRAELEVAYRLLADRRLEVIYEPYASAKLRGPDFGVTYRANHPFNLEVARLRPEPDRTDLARFEERILRVTLAKLGQMQPGMANLLVLHTGEEQARQVDLERLMQAVKTRAERKDPAFYAAVGYPGPAAFLKDFLRLSAILLWVSGGPTWANRQARPALEPAILRLVAALVQTGPAETPD